MGSVHLTLIKLLCSCLYHLLVLVDNITCHMTHVTYHMGCVSCHMSHITCDISHLTRHMALNFSCPKQLLSSQIVGLSVWLYVYVKIGEKSSNIKTKSCNFSKIVLVLVSASIERVGVSRIFLPYSSSSSSFEVVDFI